MLAALTSVGGLVTAGVTYWNSVQAAEVQAVDQGLERFDAQWDKVSTVVQAEALRGGTLPWVNSIVGNAYGHGVAAQASLDGGDLDRARLELAGAQRDLRMVPVALLWRMAVADAVIAERERKLDGQAALGVDVNASRENLTLARQALDQTRAALGAGDIPSAQKAIGEVEARLNFSSAAWTQAYQTRFEMELTTPPAGGLKAPPIVVVVAGLVAIASGLAAVMLTRRSRRR